MNRKKPPPTSARRNVEGVGQAKESGGVQRLSARQQREPALAPAPVPRDAAQKPPLDIYLPLHNGEPALRPVGPTPGQPKP